MSEANTGHGQFVEEAEQARKDSLKIGKTYLGPLGESYSSPEQVQQAQQSHVSRMIGDKHARK